MKSVLKHEIERKHLNMSKIWLLTVFVGLAMNVVIFIQLSLTLLENNSFPFDSVMIQAVRSDSSQIMDTVMVFITHLGSSTMLGFLLIVGMVCFFLKYKDLLATLCFFTVVAGGGLLNSLLKIYFNRDRPNDNRLIEVDGLSFPSGHSMGSMLLYGFLVYLSLRYDRRKIRKVGVVTSLICLIFLIGISRIYLGVHYPSDVFAGFLAGIVWLGGWVIALELAYIWNNKKRLEY
ncbi:phosphatase PAP2 family protein [Metabacillus endolithicus]|uniref:Phosphatase PAP2 family protein n=2 Tax=Metabacillus endolithicus TaxID=1535204 RepID=A0ABW5C312_9BACI|nr:phosphatase PAP2 family protein [Metabacillus endolithicus]UPG62581.1 phosphatase PAP2 family protein [Metabacillus endolithicus]